MDPFEYRAAWEERTEAILPVVGALAALGILLAILIA